MNEKLGGTLGLGVVHYQGGRDELNRKCRERDDEIDRLKSEISDARRKVIEECADIADLWMTPEQRTHGNGGAGAQIRALLTEEGES